MTEKDFKKLPKNEACPFLNKLQIKEHKKLVEIASLKDSGASYELHQKGANQQSFGIMNNVKIEELVIADKRTYEGIFIKFFKTKFLSSLNTYSLKIFVYIAENLEINNNKLILDVTKLSVDCNINEPRKIYDGLAELIDKNIIAKHSTEDVYYVNPAIIFRGANRRILFTHKNY